MIEMKQADLNDPEILLVLAAIAFVGMPRRVTAPEDRARHAFDCAEAWIHEAKKRLEAHCK